MFDEQKERIRGLLENIRKEVREPKPSKLLVAECCVDIESQLNDMELSSMDVVEVAMLRRDCQNEIQIKASKGEVNSENIGDVFEAILGSDEE